MKQPYEKHILHDMEGYDEHAALKDIIIYGLQVAAAIIVLLLVYGWTAERDAHAATNETTKLAFAVIEQCLGDRPGVIKIGDEHFMCAVNSMGVFK
jgi:hypothetical protein